MPYSTKHCVIGVVTVAVLAAGVGTATAQAAPDRSTCSWTVQKLPAVPGFKQSSSYGTDHASHVFGAVTNDSGLTESPTVWSTDAGTPPRVLGSAHGADTRITALNAAGVAVGYYHDSTGRHPVRYVDGAYQDLPVPADARQAEAVDINAGGDIVGTVDGSSIILWPADRPGSYTVLPKAAGDSAAANGIDNARNIVGTVGHDDQITAYVWNSAGKATALPTATAGTWAAPRSIRNGRVVGAEEGSGRGAVIVWDLSGRVLWRLVTHGASSINADGLVSGWQSVPDGLVQQVMRNGRVVAPVPSEQGFFAAGGSSALTDSGLLAGDVQQQVATARCR
ncbi:hypothetical protein [Kutzneria kofuensis]|uniref:HAF family extracellular repeat protein n=1 Tax=Kutzneria kofuensis TaxID=103725 RepID=A0A7W9KMZ1_9PSEU|nr:hypothetical protein [Kutzneria kofuensis]MBB5894799.1 hypothetical protein [Kutzneria kofuensis]